MSPEWWTFFQGVTDAECHESTLYNQYCHAECHYVVCSGSIVCDSLLDSNLIFVADADFIIQLENLLIWQPSNQVRLG